jgi:predicted small integral membrane protein
MRLAKIIALLGILAMTAVLIYGFTIGDFFGEGGRLLAMPWGIVSLVDLYTGFTLFSCWIIYRERSLPAAIIWTVAMMVLGFFAGSLYAFLALQSSGGDWRKFWLGKHA